MKDDRRSRKLFVSAATISGALAVLSLVTHATLASILWFTAPGVPSVVGGLTYPWHDHRLMYVSIWEYYLLLITLWGIFIFIPLGILLNSIIKPKNK